MMAWLLVLAFFAEAIQVTPVQKVIQLLNGMSEKAKAEKIAEEHQYETYRKWCMNTLQGKDQDITDADEQIEALNASIQKHTADIGRLQREVAVHEEDIAVWHGDINAGTKVRDMELADYQTTNKDYGESIDALGRAINVLQEQRANTPQAQSALLQIQNLIPAGKRQALTAFLQHQQEPVREDEEVSGYEFQSKGVVEMLKELEQEFGNQQAALQQQETLNRDAYDKLMEDMESKIAEATRQTHKKKASIADHQQKRGNNEADKADTEATREDDMKYREDTAAVCQQKDQDFANRNQLRGEEIEAINKAIEILSSPDVKGAAEKHLPQLVQKSLVQLRASSVRIQGDNAARVVAYLVQQANKLHSRTLSVLAERAGADPFVKVKKMIEDLIVRLMEEASQEADAKQECDKNLNENEQQRKKKTSQVEKLHSKSDQLKADIAKLEQEISDLTTAIEELNKAMKEATEMRNAEKATNAETVADAQGAQKAVKEALKVLQTFYEKSGQATSFTQQPEIFDRPYKGLQAENGGVIGMLEVIQSDFARKESETKAAEEQSQREYEEFTADSTADKDQKAKDIEHKEMRKQDQSQELEETTSNLEDTQDALGKSLQVYDALEAECIDTGLNYEDRVAQRKAEVASLQEALAILSENAPSL